MIGNPTLISYVFCIYLFFTGYVGLVATLITPLIYKWLKLYDSK